MPVQLRNCGTFVCAIQERREIRDQARVACVVKQSRGILGPNRCSRLAKALRLSHCAVGRASFALAISYWPVEARVLITGHDLSTQWGGSDGCRFRHDCHATAESSREPASSCFVGATRTFLVAGRLADSPLGKLLTCSITRASIHVQSGI